MKSFPFYLLNRYRKMPTAEAGLSTLEVIAGILIIGLALAATAPPLALSAASRIQNRRIQQANELGRREIARVSALMTRTAGIPQRAELGLVPPAVENPDPDTAPAPTAVVSDRSALNSTNNALLVDVDSDKESDFFIQMVRNPGIRFGASSKADQLAIFDMVIRVYDAAAIENLGNLESEPLGVSLVSSTDASKVQPLSVLRTTISQSDASLSLQEIREYTCDQDSALDGCTL